MKTLTRTLSVAAIILVIAFAPRNISAQARIDFQIFYDNLSPYGYWVDYPHYGYVWVPNAGTDFTPYLTNGYWVYTDYGWTWVSNYEWGWAPFHYGRWDYDNNYGWFWVPGDEWGPAWVVWSRADGYYGWTPLKPGISINVFYSKRYHVPHNHWVFVRDRDFEDHDLWHNHVNRSENVRIINNSTIIINTHREDHHSYFSGPDQDDVQRRVGRPVRRMAVHPNDRPAQRVEKEKVYMYKPEVQKQEGAGRRVSPKPIERWESPNVNRTQNRVSGQQRQESNRVAPASDGRRQQVQKESSPSQQSQVKKESSDNGRRQQVQRENSSSQKSEVRKESSDNAKRQVKKENNQSQPSNNDKGRRR